MESCENGLKLSRFVTGAWTPTGVKSVLIACTSIIDVERRSGVIRAILFGCPHDAIFSRVVTSLAGSKCAGGDFRAPIFLRPAGEDAQAASEPVFGFNERIKNHSILTSMIR